LRAFFGSSSAWIEPSIGKSKKAAKLRASDSGFLKVGNIVSGMLEHSWIKKI
jgi:hypothetical protein